MNVLISTDIVCVQSPEKLFFRWTRPWGSCAPVLRGAEAVRRAGSYTLTHSALTPAHAMSRPSRSQAVLPSSPTCTFAFVLHVGRPDSLRVQPSHSVGCTSRRATWQEARRLADWSRYAVGGLRVQLGCLGRPRQQKTVLSTREADVYAWRSKRTPAQIAAVLRVFESAHAQQSLRSSSMCSQSSRLLACSPRGVSGSEPSVRRGM